MKKEEKDGPKLLRLVVLRTASQRLKRLKRISMHILHHSLSGKILVHFDKIMHEVSQQVRGNNFAKTVVEAAIIDLAARSKNIPAFELFGGQIHTSLPIAWTLASGNTAKDIEEAKEFLHQKRHNIFKLKIGKGDPFKNVEHVQTD